MVAYQGSIRDSSFRRSTRVTSAAICAAVEAGSRHKRLKIGRTCDTVTAGVFPPELPPLQTQGP